MISFPVSTSTATSLPSDWNTYRSTKYGFEFSYPASWGDVEFGEAFATGTSYKFVRRLRMPDTGAMFVGNFDRNEACGFGAITTNYSYPSDMTLFVAAGWEEQKNRYYSLWPDASIREQGSKQRELFPKSTISIASGDSKALLIEHKDYDNFDSMIVEAEINLPDATFHGLSIGCRLFDSDPPEQKLADRRTLELILSTFRYTNGST